MNQIFKLFFLFVMLFGCFSIQARIIDKEILAKMEVIDADTDKWHPKMFYVVLPNLSLSFVLPYEPEQSGVHNIFFISKKSGETLLLDTVKNNERYVNFTLFSSGDSYDAVLLYNNGKYVKYNDIVFDNITEVNMEKDYVHPPDSASRQWLTMRAFNTAVGERGNLIKKGGSNTIGSKKIWGYSFDERGESAGGLITMVKIKDTILMKIYNDGYFEVDVDDEDTQHILEINTMGHRQEVIKLPANSGLVILMKLRP